MNAKKLFIIPALFIAFGALGQEANLTVKPVVKKKYDLNLNSLTDVTQTMAGMEMKASIAYTAKAVMEIEEVNSNGNFTVLSTWKDIEVTSSVMGKDTTLHAENMNVTIKTIYDKSGKIIKSDRMNTSGSTDPAVAMIEQLGRNVKLPVLPAKTTKKGDTWQSYTNDTIQTMEFPMAMIIDVEDEYSFAGSVTENGVEYYRINKAGPTRVSAEGKQEGMDMHIEGTGMNESYLLLDKATLLPVKIEEKTGMDMSIIMSGPQSMAIPMTQNTVTKIKFSEVK
ncbi:hypothetical protein [uncultured Proteiniphilum sp.]|uniref:hypothetical protein n=1 Tax=uncultured Proteiniphilum sp. TaxID=497637 RepID=UPI0026219DB3|nr:hypothetical protein [uncultured Proteiniphilum sp.]